MSRILTNLNDAQRDAVTHLAGPMLVVAGAGSGKTRVVTRRIAYLIEQGVPERSILALTFTNKAANEMAERVEALVGPVRTLATTFHSACARFLRFDIDRLDCGRDRRFTIYDADDQKALVKEALKDLYLDEKRWTPRQVLDAIGRMKTEMVTPEEALTDAYGPRQEGTAKAYQRYEEKLLRANAIDFDDLLWMMLRLLQKVPALQRAYQERFTHVLVDEYQDTNRVQYLLLRLLAGGRMNLHATGDPDQSIYSWRGAEYRNIMDFRQDYPGTKIVMLEENYRSSARILRATNALISQNAQRYPKELRTAREGGEPIRVIHLPDDRAEAAWVAREILRLRGEGRSLREIAIFYRVNAQSRPLEEVFMRETIPYAIVGGVRFYERMEVKDLLAYLRAAQNPRDDLSFRRLVARPPRGVGAKTLDAIAVLAEAAGEGMMEAFVAEDFPERWGRRVTGKLDAFRNLCKRLAGLAKRPVRGVVETILELSGLKEHYKDLDDPRAEDRSENIEQMVNRAAEYDQLRPDGTLAGFLEEIALVADVDQWAGDADQVTMMTIHSAKGLEFPAVFVTGVEEGLLPHKNSAEDPAAVEEERRLLYVAMTRAEERVYLTAATQRLQWGQIGIALPSPFLEELPAAEVEEEACREEAFPLPGALTPAMGANRYAAGRRAPVGQDRRRLLGAGQPRMRKLGDYDPFDDLGEEFDPADEVQEHPTDDFDSAPF